MFRDEMLWLYELGMEAYRTAWRSGYRMNPRAKRSIGSGEPFT